MQVVIINSIDILYVISSFRLEAYENCALLGYYAASSGNSLADVPGQPTNFLDSWPLKLGLIDCFETSVRYYHYSLRNNPEERSSLVYFTGISLTLLMC
jgi:hypothetical protein